MGNGQARAAGVLAAAAMLWLAGTAWALGDEVRTRGYGKGTVPGGRVATRHVAEPEAGTMRGGLSFCAVSVVPGVSVPPEDWDVVGLRLNLLAGRHRDLAGVDIGLLGNELTGKLAGLQGAGVWNRVHEAGGAVQGAGIANVCKRDFRGVQSAGVANLCERDFKGVQAAGIYNLAGGELVGLQLAIVNNASGFTGMQMGVFNFADHGDGVQIGVVNVARTLAGLQIGFANLNRNSTVPFLPIVNFAF